MTRSSSRASSPRPTRRAGAAKISYNTTVPWPNAPGALGESGTRGWCRAARPHWAASPTSASATRRRLSRPAWATPPCRTPRASTAAERVEHLGRGGVLREEDAGQRHDLDDLRRRPTMATRSSTTSTPSCRTTSVLLDGQEHPLGAGVGHQPEAGLGVDLPLAGRLPAAPGRSRRSRSSRSWASNR